VIRYRGLTWDHPRGAHALAAAARRLDPARDGIALAWDRQPLEGFESHPIADLCARYDLVVLDHPHVGEAVAQGCLRPVDELFPPEEIADWSACTIGPCLTSYRYAGAHWALPLDAATQVMAATPRVAAQLPRTWSDVVSLSATLPVALCVAGPHAILTFFSIATAFGEPPATADPDVLVSPASGDASLDLMATLYDRMPPVGRGLNPIALLRAMTTGDDIALCPLVYGYVNYAAPSADGRTLTFHDAPRGAEGGRPGSTLGGTGIGISRHCQISPALLDHLRWLMSADAQVRFIPAHDGQPSRREAWHDADINSRCGNFYTNTAETLEHAYVRPRHDGYIGFQTEASGILRLGLGERVPHPVILNRLQMAYARSRPAGAER
jgi:multiple sugar transport system substrate-binding protein